MRILPPDYALLFCLLTKPSGPFILNILISKVIFSRHDWDRILSQINKQLLQETNYTKANKMSKIFRILQIALELTDLEIRRKKILQKPKFNGIFRMLQDAEHHYSVKKVLGISQATAGYCK